MANAVTSTIRPDPRPLLARRPAMGLGLALAGALIFSVLAVNVLTNGPLLAWDMPIDQALHERVVQASPSFWT